jgi:hypothetical protein
MNSSAFTRSLPRAGAAAVALLATATLLAYAGTLTNWFQYALSLEGTFALAPALVAVVITLVCSGLGWQRASWKPVVLAALSLSAGVALSAAAHRQAFGTWMPSLSREDVKSSGTAVLETRSGPVRYHLDLHNPFARSHREVLTLVRDDHTYEFALPIFSGPAGGYGGASTPADWIELRTTDDPDVFHASVGSSLLVKNAFLVNLKSGGVVKTPPASN